MLGVIIAISIIGIITLILLSSLCFRIKISDTVYFSISFLGLKLFTIDPNKKSTKKKSIKSKPNKELGKKKLTTTLKEFAKGKTRKELIEEVLFLVKDLCVKLGKMLKHVKFQKLEFSLMVASQDAAKTAILYGNMCSIVYSICAALNSAYNFDAQKVSVSADFSSEEMKMMLNGAFKIKLVFVIQFLIKSAFSIIKLRMGEVKNGRT